MTSETKTFIEFTDIRSLQIDCLECGAKLALPIGNIQRHPVRCENCNADRAWTLNESDAKLLLTFLEQLHRMQEMTKRFATAKSPASKISLEIAGLEKG